VAAVVRSILPPRGGWVDERSDDGPARTAAMVMAICGRGQPDALDAIIPIAAANTTSEQFQRLMADPRRRLPMRPIRQRLDNAADGELLLVVFEDRADCAQNYRTRDDAKADSPSLILTLIQSETPAFDKSDI